jgi:hypothetical protein
MTSIWVESLVRSFDGALGQLAAAVRDCPEPLWEAPMWPVPGAEVEQRRSAPWAVAWHALECLDYDLTGELGPWAPPPPFAGHPHWRLTELAAAWSQSDVLGYVDHCRDRVRDTLTGMTEERAATPLPPAHRYQGQPHAWVVASLVGHTVEHAAQIRQVITAAG